jgi:hypothetical protein
MLGGMVAAHPLRAVAVAVALMHALGCGKGPAAPPSPSTAIEPAPDASAPVEPVRAGSPPAQAPITPAPTASASASASTAADDVGARASTAPLATSPVAPPRGKPGGKPGGRIDPKDITRIIKQNFGRFRLCYENGLRDSPNLQARVSVRFVIDVDGSVREARDGGSDLPDSATIACIVRAMYGLSFPAPQGGTVTVTYPFLFSPGG